MTNEWKMTAEEWKRLKGGEAVFVQRDSGGFRPARFVTGAKHFAAKVVFEGETEETLVAAKNISLRDLSEIV